MPTIPVGYSEATFIFNCTGSTRDVTWTCGIDDVNFATTDAIAQALEVYTEFSAVGRPYTPANLNNFWTFQGVSITRMLETGPQVGQFLGPIVGTLSGAPVPINCALLMSKSTNEGGRRNRGRAFLPPVHLAETAIDQVGVFASGVAATIRGFFIAAWNELELQGITPVLFHATAPFTPTPVVGFSISTQLATQRRRMRR